MAGSDFSFGIDDEELRKRLEQSSAIDGLVNAQLDDSGFTNAGDGQTFPGNYSAVSQTRDLASPDGGGDNALGALVAKGKEPDPIQEQIAAAASALHAENNPDPMADPLAEPDADQNGGPSDGDADNQTPIPESLKQEKVLASDSAPLDVAAGGGGVPEDNVTGTSEDKSPLTPTEQRDLDAYRKEFGTNPDGSPIDKPAAEAVPAADPKAAEETPVRPGKGPDDANRTPAAEDLPAAYGTGAGAPASADDAAKVVADVPSNNAPPKAGSAQSIDPFDQPAATQPEPKTSPFTGKTLSQAPAAVAPAAEPAQKDLWAALREEGAAQKQKMLATLGERPGVNGWALVADAVFNRGRSLPQIIAQADAAGRAYDEDKRRIQLKEADPISQQLRLQGLQNSQATLEQRKAEAKAKSDKDAAAGEQNVADRDAFLGAFGDRIDKTPGLREKLEKASPAVFRSLATEYRERWKQSPEYQDTHAHGRELDSAGAARGTAEGEHEVLPTIVENKSAVAKGVATEQAAAGAFGRAESGNAPLNVREQADEDRKIEAAKLAREGAARADREEKRREADAQTARETQQRQQDGAFKTHFNEKMTGAMDMAAALDTIDRINDKYGGKNVPGKGAEGLQALSTGDMSALWQRANAGDPAAAERIRDAHDYSVAVQGLSIDRLYEKSGKTFGQKEIAINAARMAQNPLATPEDVQSALETLRGIVQRGIAGEGSPRPDLTRQMFEEKKLSPNKWLPSQWMQDKTPTAQPTAADVVPPPPPSASMLNQAGVTQAPAAPSGIVPAPGADPNGGPPVDSLPADTVGQYPGSGASGSLGDTGGRRNVPPVPIKPPPPQDPVGRAASALANAGKPQEVKVTITVNGQTFDEEDTPEKISKFEREHPGAIIRVRK